MPLVKGKLVTAAAATAQNLCPECGDSLTAVNPIAHLNLHWKATPPKDKRGDEARARQALLTKFIADNKVRTSNMPKPAAGTATPLP